MDTKFDFISPYERNCSTIGFLLELLDDTEANTDVKLVQYFVEAITIRNENLWMHKIINFKFCNQDALLKKCYWPGGKYSRRSHVSLNRPIMISEIIRKIGLDMLRDVNKVKASSTNNNPSFIREPFFSCFTK